MIRPNVESTKRTIVRHFIYLLNMDIKSRDWTIMHLSKL